jgi:hypothetical protein
MQTDDNLTELFDRAVADLAPDVNAMVRNAEQLGRRLRRRSKFWQAGGSTLAVTALAGAGFAAWLANPLGTLGHEHGARAAIGSARAGSASGHARAAGSVTKHAKDKSGQHAALKQPAAGQQTTNATPATPMTHREMLHVLRSLLPAGAVLTKDPTAATAPGSLEVNYNDGHGMVDIMIDITPFDKVVTDQQLQANAAPAGPDGKPLPYVLTLSCPNPLWTDEGTRPAGALPISCAVRTPPGGGVERDAVMYADGYGFYGYGIYDQRPDGIEVFIQVGNGYFDPYLPHVDRPTPPGSMSLWESVVESPAWHG